MSRFFQIKNLLGGKFHNEKVQSVQNETEILAEKNMFFLPK